MPRYVDKDCSCCSVADTQAVALTAAKNRESLSADRPLPTLDIIDSIKAPQLLARQRPQQLSDAAMPNSTTIIFIPGMDPKPPFAIHRHGLWRTLLAGVQRVDRDAARALAVSDAFQLIPWNRLYYGVDAAPGDEAHWIDRLIAKTTASADDRALAKSRRWQYARMLYSLADTWPLLLKLFRRGNLKNTITETQRYFDTSDVIGRQVRELVKAPLRAALNRGTRVLLIGHSLGSVIAYDALWELWHEERLTGRVDLFLTLGSPLGTHFVRSRLRGAHEAAAGRYPGNIRRWINVAAEGDLVTLDRTLADDYDEMVRSGLTDSIEDVADGIFTFYRNGAGPNFHRSYGYLVHPAVGAIVANWWFNAPLPGKSPDESINSRNAEASGVCLRRASEPRTSIRR